MNMADEESRPVSVAIHQPNYVPWLGYFFKMFESDIFVYLDSVQYPRGQSFSARNRIKTPNGPMLLTVPVSIPSGNDGLASYADVQFAGMKWKKKHLRALEMNYRKAPHFVQVFDRVGPIIESAESFLEMNLELLESTTEYLGIRTRRERLSELLPGDFGQKTHLIVDICQALNATRYISGKGGGQDYNDEQLLDAEGIELVYSNFSHPVYPQLWGEFEPNLSILDLLFNCGPESAEILKSIHRS